MTGGAQGFGREFTERLLTKGAKVCFCDINEELGKNAEKSIGEKFGADNVLFVRYKVPTYMNLI